MDQDQTPSMGGIPLSVFAAAFHSPNFRLFWTRTTFLGQPVQVQK